MGVVLFQRILIQLMCIELREAAAFLCHQPIHNRLHPNPIPLHVHASKSDGFWQEPSTTLNSLLASPPPKEILDQIRAEPYKGGFEPVSDLDAPQTPKITYGSVPKDLVGTLAINSPGRIRIGARLLGHWFDGDGYVSTLSFDGNRNQVKVFGKFVRTARFLAQEAQQQHSHDFRRDPEFQPPLAFSGAWTKKGNGHFFENIVQIPKNPSNTAVMWLPPLHESSVPRLYALCEGGHPIEMDPKTLEVLHDEQPFKSNQSTSTTRETVSSFFSAHYSIDPNDETIYNHGYILDLISPPSINLMKLSPSGELQQQEKSLLPYNTFVHDSTISQSFVVYVICPYITPSGLDLIPFIVGQKPLGGLMRWLGGHSTNDIDRCKSYLHVHSKKDLKLKWRIEIPHPMTAYHVVDAFEEETDEGEILLKVRVAELSSSNPECDRPLLEKQFSNQYAVPMGTRLHSTLREYTFVLNSTGKGTFLDCSYIGDKVRDSIPCDYPVTNKIGTDNRVRYTWVNTLAPPSGDMDGPSDWFDAVQKIDLENCRLSSDPITFGDGVYCGPPLFIPKQRLVISNKARSQQSAEDDGYIIVVLYISKEHRSDIAILDSATMKILCHMELECHLTYSFHGEFIPGYVAVQ
ncbi:hypothetical protein ACHAXN_002753 [Cyclotella atomus]